MSGHSKWAQIKHRKAASDAKKGKIFSKLSRMITISSRELGPDPKTNSRLAFAIEEAKRANMPSDNIERAILKAGIKDTSDLKEVFYEAYGPGGSALMIFAVTDNSNRTTNEIKHILSKYGLKLGERGSALWAFDRAEEKKTQGEKFSPKFPINLSPIDSKKFEELLSELDDHEDIQEVYSNAELSL